MKALTDMTYFPEPTKILSESLSGLFATRIIWNKVKWAIRKKPCMILIISTYPAAARASAMSRECLASMSASRRSRSRHTAWTSVAISTGNFQPNPMKNLAVNEKILLQYGTSTTISKLCARIGICLRYATLIRSRKGNNTEKDANFTKNFFTL